MLARQQVESILRGHVTVDHRVTVLSPYSFRIRPEGFEARDSAYSVVVDRSAFHLVARVTPDYMAIGVRAAVSAGIASNPTRLEHLRNEIERAGWVPDFDLGPASVSLGAFEREPSSVLDDVLAPAVKVAALLSEFVLDQMIVTHPVGEMRPSVPRSIWTEEQSDLATLWEYDPSERDRATQEHRALENWLIATLQEAGLAPLDAAGEPFFDVAWRSSRGLVVCEVKTTANNEREQMRLGLGQVLHYASQLRAVEAKVWPVLLVEAKPGDGSLLQACSDAGVFVLWPDAWNEMRQEVV